MKTFCPECGMNTETFMRAEIRECYTCCTTWEAHDNPETTALRAKIKRHADDLALHCKQYNAGVDDAKSGKVCGPRPEFDTSTYYDGYAATMLPVLRERIAELEAALAWYADPENYLTVFDKPGQVVWNVMYEGGERARKALKGGE